MSVKLPLKGDARTTAMADVCRDFYGHDTTTSTTYINDNIVVRVVAFLSANQAAPGRPRQLFFLESNTGAGDLKGA